MSLIPLKQQGPEEGGTIQLFYAEPASRVICVCGRGAGVIKHYAVFVNFYLANFYKGWAAFHLF